MHINETLNNKELSVIEFINIVVNSAQEVEENKKSIFNLENNISKIAVKVDCLLEKLDTLSKVDENIKKINDQLENQNKQIITVQQEKRYLENQLQGKERDIERLNIELKTTKDDYINKASENMKIEENLSVLKQKYSEIKNRLEFTDEKLQKNESELQEMGKKAKEKEKIIEKLKEDIEVLTSKNNILQNQLNVWHENLNVYSDLLEKIRNCSSMKEFYQKIGLDDCSEESKILKLVIAIGKEKQFSKNLYDFMKTEKKQNKKELSYDEKQVYDAVNKCYRMAANVEFDLFVLPDKKSVLEDCSDKMDFDAKDMEDLMDSKNKGFKITKIIYVPALLSLDNGEIVGKCLVEGKMS